MIGVLKTQRLFQKLDSTTDDLLRGASTPVDTHAFAKGEKKFRDMTVLDNTFRLLVKVKI